MNNSVYFFLLLSLFQVIEQNVGVPFEGHRVELRHMDPYHNQLIQRSQPVAIDYPVSASLKPVGVSLWFQDCANLTETLEEFYSYSSNFTSFLYRGGSALSTDLAALLDCSGLTAITCVIGQLEQTRKDLFALVPEFNAYRLQGIKLFFDLENEISSCF